jgi:CubicO group peptidase (beta-lactamase class C family)
MKKSLSTFNWFMFNRLLLLALFVLTWCLPPASVGAQAPSKPDLKTLDTFVQENVQKYRVPGFALAVIQNGQVVFTKGYGQATPNTPVTPSTQFFIGSVNKSFIGIAVMQLVEQGKIELDAPVQRYIPWFQVADPEASRAITIRHLLNHTSGLYEDGDRGANNLSPTLTEQIQQMRLARLSAPAGTKFQYDTQNYRLLGLVIEQVSGQPFADYLSEHLLQPMDMTHTVTNPAQATELAQGHGQFFGLALPRNQPYQPAGLPIITDVQDMAKLAVMMLNQGHYGENALLQSKSFEQLITPPTGIDSDYAMGWNASNTPGGYNFGGKKVIFNGGTVANYQSMVVLIPEEKSGIVYLVNQNGLLPMFTSLTSIKLGLMEWLTGQPLSATPFYDWLYWLMAALALIEIGSQIYRSIHLKSWLVKSPGRPGLKRWLGIAIEIILPAFIIWGFPAIMISNVNANVDWANGYDMLPDGVFWLLFSSSVCLLRGSIKLVLVLLKNVKRPAPAES